MLGTFQVLDSRTWRVAILLGSVDHRIFTSLQKVLELH